TASWTGARCTRRGTGGRADNLKETRRSPRRASFPVDRRSAPQRSAVTTHGRPAGPSVVRARRRRVAVRRGRRQVGAGRLGRFPGVVVDAGGCLVGRATRTI